MEEFLAKARQGLEQLGAFWASLNRRGRITLVVGAMAVSTGLALFVHQMSSHTYGPLYTELAEAEAGRILARLDAFEVPYRLNSGGTAILVPVEQVNQLRLQLAAEGLPETGRLGFELFDQANFGATEFAEHVNYQRALEGELERTIVSLNEVARARVHVTLPRRSVFLEEQQPAKASIVLGLYPGRRLTAEQTRAITYLAASAVEDLDPSRVAVMDQTGHLFSQRFGGTQELTERQLEYRRSLEHDAVRKIIGTLEPRLGPGGVRANVAVEVDWDVGEQTAEVVDPNLVLVNRQRTAEGAGEAVAAGPPGTASNLPRDPAAPQETAQGLSRTSETTNYQSSRTVTRMKIERGNVNRMSIAVLVDYRLRVDEQARRMVREPRDPQELETIRNLVIAASGARPERGDLVHVESLPFSMLEDLPELPEPPTDPADELFTLEWFRKQRIYLVGALLVVLLAVGATGWWRRRRRMVSVLEERQKALEAESERQRIAQLAAEEHERREAEEARMLQGFKLSSVENSKTSVLRRHLEETADESPDRFARIVRTWVHEDD